MDIAAIGEDDFLEVDDFMFDMADTVKDEDEILATDFIEYRGSLAGVDLMDDALAFVDYALSLNAYVNVEKVVSVPPEPVPGVVASSSVEGGPSFRNGVFAALLGFHFQRYGFERKKPLRCAIVGGGRGSLLRTLIYQRQKTPLDITLYDWGSGWEQTALIAKEFPKEKQPIDVQVQYIERDVTERSLDGTFDLILVGGCVNSLDPLVLQGFVADHLRLNGMLLTLYFDLLKASRVSDIPGFRMIESHYSGEGTFELLGTVYKERPFLPLDVPLSSFTVVHCGHQEIACHQPWSNYVPAAFKNVVNGGLGRLYNVYMVLARPSPDVTVPPLISLDEWIACPTFSVIPTSLVLSGMDRPIGLTQQDLVRHVVTQRTFYKEKFDGRPFILLKLIRGMMLFDWERKIWYCKAGTLPITIYSSTYVAAQYELMGSDCHLVSINQVVEAGDPLPINFYDRNRYMEDWFFATWHKLSALQVPVLFEEGFVLSPMLGLSITYKHFEELADNEIVSGHVGASYWVKRRPTADIRQNGIVVEIDIYTGEVVRERPEKEPNDAIRLLHLADLASIEEVILLAPFNGSLMSESEPPPTNCVAPEWREDVSLWAGDRPLDNSGVLATLFSKYIESMLLNSPLNGANIGDVCDNVDLSAL